MKILPWDKKWFQFTLLMIMAFVWGSSFILMKIGLKSFTSEQAASLRIGFASLFLLPYSIANLNKLKRADLLSLLVAGFIGSLIPAFLFTKAQTRIDSSLAGMLNSLTPVFTLIIGYLFFKTRLRGIQLLGVLMGLTGAAGLILAGSHWSIGGFNSYGLLIVLATTCYGININVVKAKLTHLNGTQITSLSFLFIGPVAIMYFITTDVQQAIRNENWYWHLGALALLGILGTAIAMLVMNTLLRYASAVFASSVTYIIPIFAISWGVIDGESISVYHLMFMAVILLGVYLINSIKKE